MTKIRRLALVLGLTSALFGQSVFAEESGGSSGGNYAKKFQFDLLGGLDISRNYDFNDQWKHQTAQSPVGQFAFHWNFFAGKPVNLIVGGQLGVFQSVETLEGARKAEATTSGYGIGPIVGIGFDPSRGSGRWRFMANFSPTIATKKTRLKSPGYTTDIVSEHSSFEFGGNLLVQFSFSENWRMLGGIFGSDAEAIALGGGIAYAF